MANPWEQYQSKDTSTSKPWESFSEKPKEKSTGQQIYEYAKPVVELAGGTLGGLAGTAAGTVASPTLVVNPVSGGALGAGLGYSGAKKGMEALGQYMGYEKPKSFTETGKEALQDVLTGSTTELGGQVLGKTIPAVVSKGKDVLKGAKLPEFAAKPTDVSALGSEMEQSLNSSLRAAQKSRSTEYQAVFNKANQEVSGKEPRIVDDFNKYVKDQLNTDKVKSLNQQEKNLILQTANNIRNKNLEGLDKEIRRLEDIADMPKLAPGYDSIVSKRASDLAKQLRESVGKASNTYKQAKDLYREMSEPVNIYESSVGKKLLEGKSDPAALPDKFFKTKYSVDNLKSIVGEQQATKFARGHIANELATDNTAKTARTWLDKNKVWLKEFPQEKQAVEQYVQQLERGEKLKSRTKNVAIAGAAVGGATEAYNQLKKVLGIF